MVNEKESYSIEGGTKKAKELLPGKIATALKQENRKLSREEEEILKNKILEDLEKYVEKKPSVRKMEINGEMKEIKGTDIHMKLGSREFNFFVSDDTFTQKEFESNPDLIEHSPSEEDAIEILNLMKTYMENRGLETDAHLSYNKYNLDMRYPGPHGECEAGYYIGEIAGIDGDFRMKNEVKTACRPINSPWHTDWQKIENGRALLSFNQKFHRFFFDYCDDDPGYVAHIFQRL